MTAKEIVDHLARRCSTQRSGQLRIDVAVHGLKRLAVFGKRDARRIALDPFHNVFVFAAYSEAHARFDLHRTVSLPYAKKTHITNTLLRRSAVSGRTALVRL